MSTAQLIMVKKLPFLLLFTVLLASCGAGENTPTTQTVLLGGVSRQKTSVQIPLVTRGERRAYGIKWSQGLITGTAISPELSDFKFFSSEVRLPDISLSYDKDGSAGQLYRLYQAAFGRKPDVGGFGFWKNILENQGWTLGQVANEFLASEESKTLYGAQSDDAIFVDRLYRNVLHRAADAGGAAYWLNVLKSGTSRVNVLLGFADSAENKAATDAALSSGIEFAEPGIAYIPVSNATGPSDVPVGAAVDVDGSISTDANSDQLHYNWTLATKPTGSIAVFVNSTTAKAKIILDKPGTYELALRVSDGSAESYSPAIVRIVAHGTVADSGTYTCSSIDATLAQSLYSNGHTYLDRDKDGIACDAGDLSYEKSPTVPSIADTGIYKCSAISHQMAVLLYMQGHTYLDRDHDGKPCESTDITLETPIYVTPTPTPSSGMCWVNGYTRKNGTHVSGYWRHC